MKYLNILFLLLLMPFALHAQDESVKSGEIVTSDNIEIDYANPHTYVVGGVKIEGLNYLSPSQISSILGIHEGNEITIPSDDLSAAIKRIWAQRVFSDIGFYVDSLSANKDTAFFKMVVQERPRVISWNYTGVKTGERDELKDRLNLRRGGELSEYVKTSSTKIIKDYFKEKGFLNAEVDIISVPDSTIKNATRVTFDIKKGNKVKIREISYEGQGDDITKFKLDRSMKKTKDAKWYNFFSSKKFNEKEYKNDKETLIEAFNELGYRDAKIVKDSIYNIEEDRLGIHFVIDKGKQYYFRNITWTGNSEYTEEQLNSVLKINPGDVYDVVTMQKRLFGGGKESELNVSQLYRDQGFLFFNISPVELAIVGDSVDVEMRVVEGKPATFNNIIVNGNTITNEKVVRRAVYTRPGYLYRQSDFERSVREISSMGHFDPEYAVDPDKGYSLIPNGVSNTVDITYNVQEKPDSQLELSGGWGARTFVGTVGVSFNNFSVANIKNKDAWRPVPLGDAQNLAFRFQTNGTYYQALVASFSEPWLGGKKPTSLNFQAYYTKQTNSYTSYYYQVLDDSQHMKVFGASLSLGRRLKWPDDYFVEYHSIGWQSYALKDWQYNFIFSNGISHNINYTYSLTRTSTDQSLYPRQGSEFAFTLAVTPPWSLMRKGGRDMDYNSMTSQEHYNWIEYNKWTFKGSVFTKLVGDLVLMARAQFGYLGYYNRNWGYSPFEGFLVGGDGMSGYNSYGSEVISLRGYENYSLTPYENGYYAGHVYDKFTVELRYPVILQPTSTIYALAFLEGGNCWSDIRDFNPFQIKRSAGAGVRIYLPMVGLLGVDWGWGFDSTGQKSQFHFVIGQQF